MITKLDYFYPRVPSCRALPSRLFVTTQCSPQATTSDPEALCCLQLPWTCIPVLYLKLKHIMYFR